MSGARVCKKKESLQELTPSVPRHLRPRTLLPGSRAALRAAAAPLSSAHLPGGLGCCPPGPRLRLSPPFLPSRLLGPRNFPECPAGRQEAGGGEDARARCGRVPAARVLRTRGAPRGRRVGSAGRGGREGRAGSAAGWSAGRGQPRQLP